MHSYVYMGTLDDSVYRFPFDFRVDDKFLTRSLATHAITGNPILLNDGYLIQHPVGRSAVMNRAGPLWCLIDAGFVRVLARGEHPKDKYPLNEMPYRMASRVRSYAELVQAPHWPELERALKALDGRLRADDNLMSWPAYNSDSGFVRLARQAPRNPIIAGVGNKVRRQVLEDFIQRFLQTMATSNQGARTEWQTLAEAFANDPDNCRDPKTFKHALMRLANEMYHYNFGLLLSGSLQARIAVETQASIAFRELTEVDYLNMDPRKGLPVINVPPQIAAAPAAKLAAVVNPTSDVGKAKLRWLQCERAVVGAGEASADAVENLYDAAEEYGRRLAYHYRSEVKFSGSESILNLAFVTTANPLGRIGTALMSTGDLAAGALGLAIYYLAWRVANGTQEHVIREYRAARLIGQIRSGSASDRLTGLLAKIGRHRVPAVRALSPKMGRLHVAEVPRF